MLSRPKGSGVKTIVSSNEQMLSAVSKPSPPVQVNSLKHFNKTLCQQKDLDNIINRSVDAC